MPSKAVNICFNNQIARQKVSMMKSTSLSKLCKPGQPMKNP